MFELSGNSTIPRQQDEVSDLERGITLTLVRDYPQEMYVLRMHGRRTEIDVDSSQTRGAEGVVTSYKVAHAHYGDDREVWRPTVVEVEDAVFEGRTAMRRLRNPESPASVVEFWPNREAWRAPR